MINTALNYADIAYLLTQQERLDAAMREEHKIKKYHWIVNMDKEHAISLNTEKHEFINEVHQVWKYWKKKPMDMTKVVDEAVDVIHFAMLLLNKSNINTETLSKDTAKYIAGSEILKDRNEVKDIIYKMSTKNLEPKNALVGILRVLDYYGFTSQDIIYAYNQKNKKNFQRLASGY